MFLKRALSKNKKAELTTQQIIMITIIIISFVVLLYFLFRLNPGETSSKQICYNSVILADKGSGLIGSLDCKTNYLTIVADGKNETLKAISDEMADCWWMFGQGKIDYVSSDISDKVSCSICSIVSFDKKTNEKIGAISYSELYDYLRTNQKTASTSYLQYIYSVNSLDVFKEFPISNYLSKSIDTTKEYFILTGMAKEGWLISSSIFSLNPFSLGNTPYPVVILEKTTENYNAVGCEDFVTKAG